jgi:hypothetical protein
MIKQGKDTGLLEVSKKGSSRAVYFPTDHDDINIDDTPTKIKTVLKLAYPGSLDKHGASTLLGEMQNQVESSRWLQHDHALIYQDRDDGKFKTNPNGILAPVFHSHEDGHYLHMAHARPLKQGDFRRLTTTPEFPKGISPVHFKKFNEMISHGEDYSESPIYEHPLAQSIERLYLDHDIKPSDFSPRNMGVMTHPVTGKEHLVMTDYGYDGQVQDAYNRARLEKYR